jgi:hypothetical protein
MIFYWTIQHSWSHHNVIIEERVPIHPKLLKISYKGTPDIRVVVFNSVPVMACCVYPLKNLVVEPM